MSTKKDNGVPPLISPHLLTEERDSRRGSITDMIAYVTGGGGGSSSSPNSPGGPGSSRDRSGPGSGLRRSVLNARAYITGTGNESGRDSPSSSTARQASSSVLKSVSSLLFLKGMGGGTTFSPLDRHGREGSTSMKSPNMSGREDSKIEEKVYHRKLARFSGTELALHAVITNPIGIGYFLGFCAAEHQIEYINFFLQVEEYKGVTGINSLFACESLPGYDAEELDIPLSWMAIDEKIFKTSSDNLLIASRDLVHTRASSKATYHRMSQQSVGSERMGDMHPLALKICEMFLHERTFAKKTVLPVPAEEEILPKRMSTSTKSSLPIRNIFVKSSGISAKNDLMSSLLSPRNYLMSPRGHVEVEDDTTPSPEPSGLEERLISGRTPICLSQRVASNTKLRLENINYYGAEAFSEAALEVFRFIAQDIYPRFVRSSWHDRMKKRGKLVTEVGRNDLTQLLPRANTLRVRPPESKILESISASGGPSSLDQAFSDAAAAAGGGAGSHHRRSTSQGPGSQPKFFDVNDIICDGILYNEFLQRLRQTSNTEYLLCLRSINVFKDIINPPPPKPKNTRRTMTQRRRSIVGGGSQKGEPHSKASSSSRASLSELPDDRRSLRSSLRSSLGSIENSDSFFVQEQLQAERKAQKLEDQAWQIYLFFVAKGSALEITLVQKHREDIMRQLATPTFRMFDNLEAAAKVQLEFIFTNYKRLNQESYVTWESRANIVAQNILNIETGTKHIRWKRELKKKIALLRRLFKRKLRKIFLS